MQRRAHLVGTEIDQIELDIGARDAGPRPGKGAGIPTADGQRTAPEQGIAQPSGDTAVQASKRIVDRNRAGALPHGPHIEVIL